MRFLSRVYWGYLAAAMLVGSMVCAGCVSAETQAELEKARQSLLAARAELETIVSEIKALKADHDAGKIATSDYKEILARLEDMRDRAKDKALDAWNQWQNVNESRKEHDETWWAVAGAVILNMILRTVGIPGWRSSSKKDLLGVGEKILNGGGSK